MRSAVRDVIDGCLDACSSTPRNEWIQDWPSQVGNTSANRLNAIHEKPVNPHQTALKGGHFLIAVKMQQGKSFYELHCQTLVA